MRSRPKRAAAAAALAFAAFAAPSAGVGAFSSPRPKAGPRIRPSAVAPAATRTRTTTAAVVASPPPPASFAASSSTSLTAVPAAGVAAAAAAAAPPSLKAVSLACLLPTLLGYYKSEYGVSYAYGSAVAAVSFLALRSLPRSTVLPHPTTVAAFHALSVVFYGVRLCAFLLYREVFVPRFRRMRERIEDRAKARGGRFARTPFILSCAGLYGCMAAPVLVTSALMGDVPMLSPGKDWADSAAVVAVVVAWCGFLLGALGDVTKSYSKALNGEDHLVTGGVFSVFRHPNYTGEVIGWFANSAAAFFAVLAAGGTNLAVWRKYAIQVAAGFTGALGISFVLGAATANLEDRQREQYGDSRAYKDWVKKSWAGLKFGKGKGTGRGAEEEAEMPDFDEEEEEGSGI